MADTDGCEFCINHEFKRADCFKNCSKIDGIRHIEKAYLMSRLMASEIFLMQDNKLMFDNSDGEYATAGVTISYCPFCGRYLLEDSKMSKITKPINICYCDACGRVCEQKERKYEVCLRERDTPQVAWTKQDLCDECYRRLIQYTGFEDKEVI